MIGKKVIALTASSLILAGGAGFLTAAAIGANNPGPPQKTVTVNVTNGQPGPPGPAGPKGDPGPAGPSGAVACPDGFVPGLVVINHPGGHVTIYGCIQ
jgi:hypothetical protein